MTTLAITRRLRAAADRRHPSPLSGDELWCEAASLAAEHLRRHLARVPLDDPRRPDIERFVGFGREAVQR